MATSEPTLAPRPSAADAVARNLDLLDRSGRESLQRARAQREPFAARLPVIVAGTRRMFDIFDLTTDSGSAGIGIDATEIETMRAEIQSIVDDIKQSAGLLRRHL